MTIKREKNLNKIFINSGEYILQSSNNNNNDQLLLEQNLLLEEALQLAGIEDLNVSIEKKPEKCETTIIKTHHFSLKKDNTKEQQDSKSEEAAAKEPIEETSAETSEDFEAILENNLKQDDFDLNLDSPLSILLDENEDLDLINDMMIQPSTAHFQHPRQPNQNYAHCVNSYRQNGYQVSLNFFFGGLKGLTLTTINSRKTISKMNSLW